MVAHFNSFTSGKGKGEGTPLLAIQAHGGCGCKGPQIHSHGTRRRQGGQSYARPPVPRGNSLVLILQEVEWTPGPVWTRRSEEKSPPIRHPGSNPGRPARSQAPCRVSHLAHCHLRQHVKFFRYTKNNYKLYYIKEDI